MMRFPLGVCVGICGGILLFDLATLHADIRPPAKSPTISIVSSPEISRPRIVIPRTLLPEPVKVGEDTSRTRTVISGVALSVGIAFCGLVLLRRRRLGSGWTAGFIVAGATLFGGGYLVANAPAPVPPPRRPILTSRPVEIVIVEHGTDVELLVPLDTKFGPQ